MNQTIGQSHNSSSSNSMFLEQSDPSQEQGFDLSKATQDAAIYYQQNRKKTSLEKVAKQFGTTVKRVRNRVKKLNENPTFNPNNFIISAPPNPPPQQSSKSLLAGSNTTPTGKVRKPTKKQQAAAAAAAQQQAQAQANQHQHQSQQQQASQQVQQQQDIQRQASIVQQQVAAANALGVVDPMHQATADPSMIQLNGLGQNQPQQILQFQQAAALSAAAAQQAAAQRHQHHLHQQQQPHLQAYQQTPQQHAAAHHGTVIDFNNLDNVKQLVNNDKLTIEEIKYVINYLITKTLGQ